MAVSPDYKAFIEDLFSPIFAVRIKAMFGGAGVYADDVMVALIADETLYLKADKLDAPYFEEAGSSPFVYESEGRKPIAMSYWLVPEELYDDPEAFAPWAHRALACARRSKKPKKRAKKKQ